ncbi:SRPBCC family protein [Nitrosomonas sp. HPC101]|uniref:SRPBCC family protein n=1 Tax=Nitrosomonas sp. HPC101 TaxID=1658667 RepID=UPI001F03EE6B|nr:SRPBCC family protein [Nitrosomonas sp. HPC101]
MKKITSVLVLSMALFTTSVVAETKVDPSQLKSVSGRHKVYNSIVVDAPIDVVWNRIKDFHDFSWAPTLVKKTENVGTKDGTTVGAKRLLNGQFLDTMIAYNPADHRINYSIDSGPSPISNKEISNYVGDLHLLPITSEGKTYVEWTGSWVSDSSEAIPYMNSIYVSLLKDLAAQFKK